MDNSFIVHGPPFYGGPDDFIMQDEGYFKNNMQAQQLIISTSGYLIQLGS